jgi:diguanylate cyclase (GGDEF)-like protein
MLLLVMPGLSSFEVSGAGIRRSTAPGTHAMYSLPASSLPPPTAQRFPAEDLVRQAVLESYAILDTAEEAEYDDLVRLAASLCATPAAIISFFDHDRQWFKARLGVDAREGPRVLSFARAMLSPDAVLIVPDTRQDPRFAGCTRIANGLPIRFYAAAPLVGPLDAMLGALCVIDHSSRQLTEAQIDALRILARQVVRHLELGRANATLRIANTKLAEMSVTDALTALANRRAFNERLTEEEARASRTGDPLCLLFIDVDHFKSFNDRFGHVAGDEALIRIADILKTCNRRYDFAARYGGEEFAVILSQTSIDAALAVAERLRAVAEETVLPFERLTLSIGVAQYDPERGAAALIKAADRALYAAKGAGRNCVMLSGEPTSAPHPSRG